MNFRQFALHNTRRNARAYLAYFLCSSFSVMIFFTYAMFIFHPDIARNDLGKNTKILLQAAEFVVFGFAFLFVLYSISSFLKVRSKEFGILTILGAQKKQLNHLIFFENMIIGSISILVGIVSGILLSKLFLLLGAKVIDIKELPLYFPIEAFGLTIIAFLALFIIVSFIALWLIRSNRTLELLMGSSKPKKEPKISVPLALLSVSCMIGGLLVMYLPQFFTSTMMLSFLGLGIIGTYFFFTQFTGVIIRLLKKNRSFFWRNTHLLWISEMAYKVKDNARMFFMITIMTAMACSAIGFFVARNQEAVERFMNSPQYFDYLPDTVYGVSPPYQERDWYRDVEKMDQEFKKANVKFDKAITSQIDISFKELAPERSSVISQSEYNQEVRLMDKQEEIKQPLKPNEAIINKYYLKEKKDLKKLSLDKGNIELNIIGARGRFDIVVSDTTSQQLKKYSKSENTTVRYHVPEWDYKKNGSKSLDLLLKNSSEIEIAKNLRDLELKGDRSLNTRGLAYLRDKAESNTSLFILVFIAAIFAVSSASFIYFKLYTELKQDQRIYNGLSKIGVSAKEMNKSATIQIAILFFLPMFVATLETVIGLIVLNKHFGYKHMFVPSLIGVSAFFIAQLIFFLLVRYRYILQLKRAMV
ncbi:putative ABC transport system permease protein [Croceifilum oryzae]|uniref:ABC transport system permease protein n=1 Tax=Croceifilum oryzae TaxID=1553429 RepID=A0AAJ1WQ54_9BACL|nr:ABC transporter permease [Croceifilum oryzae]MDQ0417192.1 putative ABC transport system permease protein [Croceifilum oryzae]